MELLSGPLPYLGGTIALILAVAGMVITVIDARTKADDRRFDELGEMYNLRVAEADHARMRLSEIRDERDELRTKQATGEITIAQLRERVSLLEAEARGLRKMLRDNGLPDQVAPA